MYPLTRNMCLQPVLRSWTHLLTMFTVSSHNNSSYSKPDQVYTGRRRVGAKARYREYKILYKVQGVLNSLQGTGSTNPFKMYREY